MCECRRSPRAGRDATDAADHLTCRRSWPRRCRPVAAIGGRGAATERRHVMHGGAFRRNRALVVFLVAATPMLLGPLGILAGPFMTGALVQVSGPSPLASCTADDVAGQIAPHPPRQRQGCLHTDVGAGVDVNP